MSDPKKFIADLELDPISTDAVILRTASGLNKVNDGQPTGFVNNKSVVSFAANISEPNQADVLNSMLLAQLAADKKYPAPEQITEWYTFYFDTLSHLGWNIESKDFSKYSSNNGIFEMDKAVIEILSVAIGANYMAIIVASLEAIKALSDSDGRIKMFEKQTHQLTKGNFQAGIAEETGGVVSIHFGAFMLETEENIRRILFFKSSQDKSALNVYMTKASLNNSIYSTIRQNVLNKLAERAGQYIAELEIN